MALEAEDGMALLLHAMEAEETEHIFQRWINGYQSMSFDAFRAKLTPPEAKTTEEILEDVGEIMHSWEVTRSRGNL